MFEKRKKFQSTEDEKITKKRVKFNHNKKQSTTVKELNEITSTTSNPYKYFNKITLINEACSEIIKKNIIPIKLQTEINKWLIEFNKFLENAFVLDQPTSSPPPQQNEKPIDNEKITNENFSQWINKEEQLSKLKLPRNFHKEYNLTKYFCKLTKPKNLQLYFFGSYLHGTNVKCNQQKQIDIDIGLEIGREYFQRDNYLNLIYYQKLSIYLFYMIKLIHKQQQTADNANSLVKQLMYRYFQDNDKLKPILEITPNPQLFSTKKTIRFLLHLHCAEEIFQLNRFQPQTNNIRPNIFLKKTDSDNTTTKITDQTQMKTNLESLSSAPPPTPQYNSSILMDLTRKINEQYLMESIKSTVTINEYEKLKQLIILLKVWLNNLQIDCGSNGFNGYILTMYVIYLKTQNIIHSIGSMDYYHLLQIVWYNLSISQWNKLGITLYDKNKKIGTGATVSKLPFHASPSSAPPELKEFHKYYDLVFIDVTGFYNICSKLSIDIYLRVRFESEHALKILNLTGITFDDDETDKNDNNNNNNNNNDDDKNTTKLIPSTADGIENFHNLFLQQNNNSFKTITQYDHYLSIITRTMNVIKEYGNDNDLLNYCGNYLFGARQVISNLLRKGLTNRLVTMTPILNETKLAWSITEKCPNITKFPIQFGLHLNHEYAFNLLDKGPPANRQPDADEFRKFWGNKSELRRFPSGEITEGCAWGTQNSTLCERRLICKDIILHLLKLHFNITSENSEIQYNADECDFTYNIDENKIFNYHPKQIQSTLPNELTNIESITLEIIKSFNELCKTIRNLQNLPLEINSCLGKSSIFRYCELQRMSSSSASIININKNDTTNLIVNECVLQLEASGKWPNNLLAINHLKTAIILKICKQLRETDEAKANRLIVKCYRNYFDCIKSKYLFRFSIVPIAKELQLLKRQITDKGIVKLRDTIESIELEKELIVLPKLTTILHTLYQKYTSFGPTVLIAKRWLYSQLIDSHLFPDICTELLIAYQYLNVTDEYSTVPFQPQLGFVRFLNLLATTNWNVKLILLNFNQLMNAKEISQIEKQFYTNRVQFSNLTIITSFDVQKNGMWSRKQPQTEILLRLQLLAEYSLNLLTTEWLSCNNNFQFIFNSSKNGYNFKIIINKEYFHTTYLYDVNEINVESSSATKTASSSSWITDDLIDKYLKQLRLNYEKFAIFFYNPCMNNEIYGLWKPIVWQFNGKENVEMITEEPIVDDYDTNLENNICCKVIHSSTKNNNNNLTILINIEQILEDFRIIGNGLIDEVIKL